MTPTALMLVLACGGDKAPDGGHTGETASGPPSFEFVSTVQAKSFEAHVADETVAAHRVASTILAGTGVVVSDQKVQDRLRTDGGAGGFRASYTQCWTRPEFPMFSFTIDYTGCSAYEMGGGVFVLDHPSGPLLFGFQDFFIGDRTMGGSFALDTRGAYPQPLFWETYNTDGTNPGLDNPVPIGVTIDRTSYGAQYLGGASVDFFHQTWSMWGTLTTGPSDAPQTVVLGGVDPADVPPDVPPPQTDVMKSSLNWLACRCPTSGLSAYDMPLHFETVTIDLDDLEVEPDEVDDPDMVIPLDYDLPGKGILTTTGCGTYDVEYQADDAMIPLPSDRLVGAVSFLCDTKAVPDLVRCNAMVDAARAVGDLQIEVKKADATATATAAVEQDFDTTFCRIY